MLSQAVLFQQHTTLPTKLLSNRSHVTHIEASVEYHATSYQRNITMLLDLRKGNLQSWSCYGVRILKPQSKTTSAFPQYDTSATEKTFSTLSAVSTTSRTVMIALVDNGFRYEQFTTSLCINLGFLAAFVQHLISPSSLFLQNASLLWVIAPLALLDFTTDNLTWFGCLHSGTRRS